MSNIKYKTQAERDAASNRNAVKWRKIARDARIAEGWTPHVPQTQEERHAKSLARHKKCWENTQQNPILMAERRARALKWYYDNKEKALARMTEYNQTYLKLPTTKERKREYNMTYQNKQAEKKYHE